MKSLLEEDLLSFRNILDALEEPMVVLHRQKENCVPVFFNAAFIELFGAKPAELKRSNFTAILASGVLFPSAHLVGIDANDTLVYLRDRFSQEHYYSVKRTEITLDQFLLRFRAVKPFEHKRIELERLNQLYNKLFSVISHDVRSPLMALKELLEMVLQRELTAESIKGLAPNMHQQLLNITTILDTTLGWTLNQLQENVIRPELFDLQELINENVARLQPLAVQKAIVMTHGQQGPQTVFADKEMISLVIRNLLSNAIKFTPAQGQVEIHYENRQDHSPDSLGIDLPKYVSVVVRDTGIGIPIAVQEKIMRREIFTTLGTAREKGTGLGLLFSQEFIALNGGNLQVSSEPGQGTSFKFWLPQP